MYRRRRWHPTPVLLPEKSHGRRSLVGCSPWGREESDTTEQLPFQFSLSCTGEGNGNPLQCSSLENPRGRGAWWAAVYGVAQDGTRLKRLSSSSSDVYSLCIHAKSLQSCLILCDLMDCSPPGFSVHRILLTCILEWCPPPGDLSDLEIETASLSLSSQHWKAGSLPLAPPGKSCLP